MSLENNNDAAWFFACWCKFMEVKNWLKNFGVGVVKNGCSHFGHRTLKMAVSQKGIDEINWFFCMLIQIQEFKCHFNNYWLGNITNGDDFLGHRTLNLSVSRE